MILQIFAVLLNFLNKYNLLLLLRTWFLSIYWLTTVTEDMVPIAVESQVQFGFLDALEGDRQDVTVPVGVYGQNLW